MNIEYVCQYCADFFSEYQCAKQAGLECDCPKCQGYCECEEEPDCDDSDDGYALASAGLGTDEDYGSAEDVI